MAVQALTLICDESKEQLSCDAGHYKTYADLGTDVTYVTFFAAWWTYLVVSNRLRPGDFTNHYMSQPRFLLVMVLPLANPAHLASFYCAFVSYYRRAW